MVIVSVVWFVIFGFGVGWLCGLFINFGLWRIFDGLIVVMMVVLGILLIVI